MKCGLARPPSRYHSSKASGPLVWRPWGPSYRPWASMYGPEVACTGFLSAPSSLSTMPRLAPLPVNAWKSGWPFSRSRSRKSRTMPMISVPQPLDVPVPPPLPGMPPVPSSVTGSPSFQPPRSAPVKPSGSFHGPLPPWLPPSPLVAPPSGGISGGEPPVPPPPSLPPVASSLAVAPPPHAWRISPPTSPNTNTLYDMTFTSGVQKQEGSERRGSPNGEVGQPPQGILLI